MSRNKKIAFGIWLISLIFAPILSATLAVFFIRIRYGRGGMLLLIIGLNLIGLVLALFLSFFNLI